MKKEKIKKFITEKKLEFFFSYLYTCTFIREYPYTSTVVQNKEAVITLPWQNHIYSYAAHVVIINGQ